MDKTRDALTQMKATCADLGMDLSEDWTVLEARRVRENERHQRELLALRRENARLRNEIRLRAGQMKNKDAE